MLRPNRGWLVSFVLPLFVAAHAAAAPDLLGSIPTGAGGGTDHKPQSKLWFNDGAWWGIFYDGSNQNIYKLDNGTMVNQAYPDAAVDSRATSRCDVLWDGTYLYVLAWHATLPRFSQYTYDPPTQTYHRLPGFPVDLPIPGLEVMVMDKDSTGRLFASFEMNQDIHVIWTTSADHLQWNLTGTIIETQVGADDIATTVAFGGNKVGVLWSDQGHDAAWRFGFRYHKDTDPPETWQPLEVVDVGDAVDDHLNIKADTDGRLWFCGKNLYNTIQLYTRAPNGGWSEVWHDINGGNCTRPSIEIDDTQNALHIFYSDWTTTPNPIKWVTMPKSTMIVSAPSVYLPAGAASLNDVTTTKQHVSSRTGILAAASGSMHADWGYTNLDTDKPTVTAVDPVADGAGVGLQAAIQWSAADAGTGVRRSSITATLDGTPIVPTIAGSASNYLLSWVPPTPLTPGHIYSLTTSVEDGAYPPHAASITTRFKAAMDPVALAKKINFQPASGAIPPGYDPDAGQAYTLDRGFGWDRTVTMKRSGVNSDPRLDTYVERKNSSAKAKWSYDVANGVYRLSLAAGAADAAGKQRVEVEGQVLLNNQTTTAGQFLTISGYDVTVQDGRLDVLIGGAGGSTKTQLCYFEFTYQGDAPPPPPPNAPAPERVTGLTVAATTADLDLQWNAVTRDTTGALVAVTRYHIYRGTTPAFVPDRAGHSNRIGIAGGTTFRDLGSGTVGTDLYYFVTAENASGVESRHVSNLGLRRRITIDPAGQPARTVWLALPAAQSYGDAASLVTSMNGGGGAGPVTRIAHLDRTTQTRQEWFRQSGAWTGANFSLVPGDAIEVTVGAVLNWNLLGAENIAPAYDLAFHAGVGNVNLLSLPQNAVYTDAQSLVQALNGGPLAGPVTKVAWLNPATGRTESWLWFANAWRGNNFPLQPATGIAVLVGADVNQWAPRLKQP